MTIRSILWTHHERLDGTYDIKIYSYFKGKKKYSSTGFHVPKSEWDAKSGRVKKSHHLASRINPALVALEAEAAGAAMGENSSLLDLIKAYISECKAGNGIKPGTWMQYQNHLKRLEAFAKHTSKTDISFSDITIDFYAEFLSYLKATGCQEAGAGKHIKILKRFMSLGLERKLHSNTEFQSKSFHAAKVIPNDKIYLDSSEILQLASLELTGRPDLRKELDRFLVSYYMLLRYGDSVKINQANLLKQGDKRYYRNVAEKTGTVSFVPVKPLVWDILYRNNFNMSGGTNQEANRKLKEIACMARIDANIGSGKDYIPKYSAVTTHTARRSAATNLLMQGVPLAEIMQLGGWKQEATLRRYLMAGGIELAQLSANHSFFS